MKKHKSKLKLKRKVKRQAVLQLRVKPNKVALGNMKSIYHAIQLPKAVTIASSEVRADGVAIKVSFTDQVPLKKVAAQLLLSGYQAINLGKGLREKSQQA